jgi:RNA polymerase sigma-70 factor (ECF subfamily)
MAAPMASAASAPSAASDTAEDLAARAESAARLVQRIRSGDTQAEAELVERFGRGVRFLLLQRTNDAARADDLFQETFRLALEKVRAGELREPEKLPGFIRQLAKNLFIADYRKTSKRSTEDLDEVQAPADPAPSQLDQVLQTEDARLVRKLLGELEPARDREVLFRFYLAGESKERICARLELSSAQFNLVIHRARQRFRTLVERARAAGPKDL